jgi:hypothetical protein
MSEDDIFLRGCSVGRHGNRYFTLTFANPTFAPLRVHSRLNFPFHFVYFVVKKIPLVAAPPHQAIRGSLSND